MSREKDDIKRYREGSLSEAQRHALEKKALHDPFLSDALEGAEQVSAAEFIGDIEELSKKIKQPSRSWFTPLRIAAGVIVLISAGSLFYLLRLQEPDAIALEKSSSTSEKAGPDVTPFRDSSSLLTLAKPEEINEKSKQYTAQPKRKEADKTGLSIAAPENKTVSGSLGETQKTETELAVAEEADKIAEIKGDEVADAKKEVVQSPVQSLPLSQRGAGMNKKESRSLQAISKVDASALSSRNISGKVLSAEDGAPLPGVTVVIKGTKRGTVTDSQGNFSLSVDDQNQRIVFSFIGMRAVEVSPENKTSLSIQLSEDVSQLSEVVVTERLLDSNQSNEGPVIKTAAPLGGLKAYNQYLESNLHYPQQALADKIKGKVMVQFTVTTNGNLSDFNVLKGIGHGCDEEVIRLVKEGPPWAPATEDDVAVESEVKVRMKFDPEKTRK